MLQTVQYLVHTHLINEGSSLLPFPLTFELKRAFLLWTALLDMILPPGDKENIYFLFL